MALELSTNKKVNSLVFTSLTLLLLAIPSLWINEEKRYTVTAPMFIDSSVTKGVIFNIDNILYHTDLQGNIISYNSYSNLGLKKISDVKFLNQNILLVEEGNEIKLCNLSLSSCQTINQIQEHPVNMAKSIIVSSDNHSFYIIVSEQNKIHKYMSNGTFSYTLSLQNSKFSYPQSGYSITKNIFVLADSGHNRVVAIRDEQNGTANVIWSLSSLSDAKQNNHIQPINTKVDQYGNIWMINLHPDHKSGDVIFMDIPSLKGDMNTHYEENFLPTKLFNAVRKNKTNKNAYLITELKAYPRHTKRIDYEALKRPLAITPHLNGMLLTDNNTFKMTYVDIKKGLHNFGDDTLQKVLNNASQKRISYANMSSFIMGVIGFSIILLLIAIVLEKRHSAEKKKTTKISKRTLTLQKLKNKDADAWLTLIGLIAIILYLIYEI